MIACIWLYENTFSIWWEPYGKVSERRRVEEIENDAKKESGYTSSRNTSLLITLYQFFATRGSKYLFLANLKKNCRTCFILICVRVLGVNPITCVEISGNNIKRFPFSSFSLFRHSLQPLLSSLYLTIQSVVCIPRSIRRNNLLPRHILPDAGNFRRNRIGLS